jgi:hypothetical protein
MFKLKLITQKLILSKKVIRNHKIGKVFFEKYEPRKQSLFNFSTLSSGTTLIGSSIVTFNAAPNRTIIGYNNNSGGYDISGKGNFVLLVQKKPNFFHRNMVKLIFGWKYIDSKKV